MKQLILALMFLLSLSVFTVEASAFHQDDSLFPSPVCVTVNGHFIKSDTPGFLKNNITMLPVRAVAEALNADRIQWNEKTSTANIHKNNTTVVLKKNGKTAEVNGKAVKIDAPSEIRGDRFYVPLRFVAETFGAEVLWNGETHTAHLTVTNETVPHHLITTKPYTDHDLYWLSRIVSAESAAEPMKGKIAVANVVLNRVESNLYPNNIYDVVFDRKHGVQFSPILNGTIFNTPTSESISAAKRALTGENYAGESLYFLNPRIAQSFWIVNNRFFYKSIGNHDFYL